MTTKVLVTGACGMIGSNLCRRLSAQENIDVIGLDNLSKGRVEYLEGLNVTLVQADITDLDSIEPHFEGIDHVVHLAAYGSVVESVEDPMLNFQINPFGTLNVLRAATKHNVKRLIFSSTGGALIGNATPPVSEISLPKPISPYGAGKLACEAYCQAFSASFGLETVCLRFANVYGSNCFHKTGVINKFFERIKQGQSLAIYGDGSSTRDYINVEDLVTGIVLALEHESKGNEVFHLATGREVSLAELAQVSFDVTGRTDLTIDYYPTRVGEVDRNFASYDRAKRVLGFEPKISLEDGLARLWQNSKEQF